MEDTRVCIIIVTNGGAPLGRDSRHRNGDGTNGDNATRAVGDAAAEMYKTHVAKIRVEARGRQGESNENPVCPHE